jgi:hypothetical protein
MKVRGSYRKMPEIKLRRGYRENIEIGRIASVSDLDK